MKKTQKTILILGNPNSWSTQQLENEVKAAGHISSVYEPGDLFPYVSELDGFDRIYFRSKESSKSERLYMKNFDAVITRLGSGTRYGKYVVRALENQNLFVANVSDCINVCGDKFATAQRLSKLRIPIPKQLLVYESKDGEEALKLIDKKPPVICKKISGSLGKGVFVLPDGLTAKMILESFSSDFMLMQRMINKDSKEKKSDIRAVCIGAETSNSEIYSYERISQSRDPRANFSIHESGRPVELSKQERDIVLRSATAVGGGVVGVDLMREKEPEKTFVIEVNSNPGLEGITQVLNINIAKKIVDYMIRESGRPAKNKPFYDGISQSAFGFEARYITMAKLLNYAGTLKYSLEQGNSEKAKIDVQRLFDKIREI